MVFCMSSCKLFTSKRHTIIKQIIKNKENETYCLRKLAKHDPLLLFTDGLHYDGVYIDNPTILEYCLERNVRFTHDDFVNLIATRNYKALKIINKYIAVILLSSNSYSTIDQAYTDIWNGKKRKLWLKNDDEHYFRKQLLYYVKNDVKLIKFLEKHYTIRFDKTCKTKIPSMNILLCSNIPVFRYIITTYPYLIDKFRILTSQCTKIIYKRCDCLDKELVIKELTK